MMRVLLISANTEKINMAVLPFGLSCVASATQKTGHEVALVDLMTEMDKESLLKEAIEGFRPEVIGISVRNIDDQRMGIDFRDVVERLHFTSRLSCDRR